MPIYEFICRQCDAHYELRRPFAEASDPFYCPECGAETVKALGNIYVSGSSTSTSAPSCDGCGSHSCGSCSHR
ncbi:MAG: hypothetical protein JXA97_04860 [Anaerolineales bacterium]|nr:hypothetical protein [Anaerolineales bacterium]